MNTLQSNSRGADLAEGLHELRDDPGIESSFLPDSPQRYPSTPPNLLKQHVWLELFLIGSLTRATPRQRDEGNSADVLRSPPQRWLKNRAIMVADWMILLESFDQLLSPLFATRPYLI